MIPRAIVLLLVLLLVGCSPQRKLQKLLAKHPELAMRDTVRDTVEAIVDYVHTDTVWKVSTDTLRIDRDRLHVRTVVQRDTIWQEAWSDADTVYVPTETIVERLVPCPEGYKGRVAGWWRVVALVLACVVALLVLVRRLG